MDDDSGGTETPTALALVLEPCRHGGQNRGFSVEELLERSLATCRSEPLDVREVIRAAPCEWGWLRAGRAWRSAVDQVGQHVDSGVTVIVLVPATPLTHPGVLTAAFDSWAARGLQIYVPHVGFVEHDELIAALDVSQRFYSSWDDFSGTLLKRDIAAGTQSARYWRAESLDEPAEYLDDCLETDWDPAGYSPAAGRYPPAAAGYSVASSGSHTASASWGYTRSPQEDTPLHRRTEPLPHNGLFVRRNNAFGTKSAIGVPDLVDQGVLIDQTHIRFDDFVTSDSDQIPEPPAGAGIAVSHGVSPAAAGLSAHDSTTHIVEIALRAAASPPEGVTPAQPLPVNFVFVVDTSGSMYGEKLDTVKAALRDLYDQLRDSDVLGIVTFDTQVRTVLRATAKATLDRERFLDLLGGLQADGGTDLNLGVQFGVDEIRRNATEVGSGQFINHLYLFSDGQPNSGENNWIRIRANVTARVRSDVTLSCFGFGSDARTRELDALAGLTGGHSTFVTRPEDVRLNLAEDLARREHLAAMNIQLRIDILDEVDVLHLYGHDLITDPAARAAVTEEVRAARRRMQDEYGVEAMPDLVEQDGGMRIFAPDLAFGETYWIVLELRVPTGSTGLGAVTAQFLDVVQRQNVSSTRELTEDWSIPADVVLAHAIGLWTSEITFYALDDLYQNDRATARVRLENHVRVLENAYMLHPGPQFREDQVTIRKLVSLTGNLGHPVNWREDSSGPVGGTIFALSTFGQVRDGYLRTRQLGMR